MMTTNIAAADFYQKLYEKYKNEKMVGFYNFYTPDLMVNDPELIQKILISDFSYFHDRTVKIDEKYDPLSAHLFFLGGQKWRDLRVKLSPTFTSGKLKQMFNIFTECGQTLQNYILKHHQSGQYIFDMKDLFSRFSTNLISSVAFGIENDCINDPNHVFHKMGLKVFEPSFKQSMRTFSFFIFPRLIKILGVKFVDSDTEKFFIKTVQDTVEYRERNKLVRNDFMNLLMQLKNQGYVSVDKEDENNKTSATSSMKKLNMEEISAQAFVFFLASFETTSSTMTFCLFELAKNAQIQQKVQHEIDEMLQSGEEVSYESISQMKYLECCIDETLRKYVPVLTLLRECTNDYKIPGTQKIIPKGTAIQIPIFGLHRDENIYDNPLEFRPERFAKSSNGEGKAKGLFYLPFGDGPRNCE
jgi:cytochrome P450 family 6